VGPTGLVYAFEPIPGTAEIIQKTMELNNIANIFIIRKAVSDSVGCVEMGFKFPGDEAATMKQDGKFMGHVGNEKYIRTISVEMISIDAFMVENRQIRRLDLIKIDAEAAELEVLCGMRDTLKRLRPKLIIEIGEPKLAAAKRFLDQFAYRTELVEVQNLRATKESCTFWRNDFFLLTRSIT
jgi:FkbM family methyltransferase